MVVEAKKSHNLPSASLRTRKASSVIHSEAVGLRTRGRAAPISLGV